MEKCSLTLSDMAPGRYVPAGGVGGGGCMEPDARFSGGLNELFQTIHGIINL